MASVAPQQLTLVPRHDHERLQTLLQKVYFALSMIRYPSLDTRWLTLAEIRAEIGCGSEAGISARLRELRQRRYGAHTVLRRRRGKPAQGLWEYRLEKR